MKKVLIISPYFPPVSAVDMHRIRISLPYFKDYEWEAEVVCVDEKYTNFAIEPLLEQTIPTDIKVHKVKALPKGITMRFGLGSIALRSLPYFKTKVNRLLKKNHYDLIYFSTTQYPVCILGSYWKRKFRIPYVIDIQDPWHTDYYRNKPKTEQPKKYWFSYRLNKFLEPLALRNVDGIISVSKGYIDQVQDRYPQLKDIAASVIPFSAELKDFEISNQVEERLYFKENDKIKILYAGVVGTIMDFAINKLLLAFSLLPIELKEEKVELYFLGTSYAQNGTGVQSVLPKAKELNIDKYIIEITDRLSFYNTLKHLKKSDGLLIIGSDDHHYIPSKIYTYVLANKPILSLLSPKSPGNFVLGEYPSTIYRTFLDDSQEQINKSLFNYLSNILNKKKSYKHTINYTAGIMAKKQIELFNSIVC